MVSLKTFLCAVLLAAPALAAPTADPTSLEALEARAEKVHITLPSNHEFTCSLTHPRSIAARMK